MKNVCAILLALAGAVAAAPLRAAPADELKALLDQRNAAAAYALGKSNPGEIGNPAFDFYFGIAAIDSGHAGEGVLALERYVVNFPDNLEGRLELARGYFVLGEDARAREEFDGVLKANPPPAVAANVERFLNAIEAREASYRTTSGVYAEIGYGRDTNSNGGVGSGGIKLPGFGNVQVAQNGVKTPSGFTWLALGGQITYPVSPGLSVFASGRVDAKLNSSASQFDQNNAAVSGGLTYIMDKNLYRLTASHATVAVENDRFRDVDSLSGEMQHQLDELQSIGPFVQLARLNYTGANEPRDADFYALGVNYRKAFIAQFQPLLTASASVGSEHNVRNRPDLGRDIFGARVALALTPAPNWSVSVGASYQRSRYNGPEAFLFVPTTRRDEYYGLDAVVRYAFSRRVSIRGEVMLTDNKSNIQLYEYNRNVYAVKLRYDF